MPTLTDGPGARVRRRRAELELSRERLAVEAGVSVATVARLELHDRLPQDDLLGKIARRLGLDLNQIRPTGDGDG